MRLLLAAVLALAAAPAFAQAPAPAAAPAPVDYVDEASWLCLPGRQDACAQPLPTADLEPAGYGPVAAPVPAADPLLDCFYVYPTISRDPGLNSDMNPGVEERGVAAIQLARFAGVCRLFAPLYRQGTLASIPAVMGGQDPAPIVNRAYDDVRAAWRRYLDHHNRGRPYVLIGHSQGTIHLTRLLASEIEGRPEAARMASALLIGFNIEIPEGRPVGGTFRETPLCTRRGQTGCVIAYVTFRAEAPPPEGALFGRAVTAGRTVACTNPAALGSAAPAPLDSYWFSGASLGGQSVTWSSAGPPPALFLHTRGLVSAACVNDGPRGYLAVSVNADPNDARTDRIPGDVQLGGVTVPGWGLHLVDVNVAQGDLIEAVRAQALTLGRGRRPAR